MRKPAASNIIACFMGAGAQIVAMFVTILICITFAFANTHWRPYLYQSMLVITAIYGLINGYVTSRMLKFYGTTDFYFSAFVSSFALPLFVTGAMVFECFFLWVSKSALRFSFKTNLVRIISWYLLNALMCFIGAFRGYTLPKTRVAVPIGKVIRPIPE